MIDPTRLKANVLRRIAADAPLFSAATLSPIAAVSAQVSGGVCAAPNLPEVA